MHEHSTSQSTLKSKGYKCVWDVLLNSIFILLQCIKSFKLD